MNWYISTNGSSWTLAATAGIVRPRLTLRANGMDELTWSMDGDMLATYPYAYGSTVYLASGADTAHLTIRFIGTVVSLPRTGTSTAESINYKAQGGWWWLEQITYQQAWQMMDQTSHTLAGKVLPRVILGQTDAGATRTMGAEVAAAIAWAISKGAPIAAGTIDSLATMPYSEQTNIPVAEVIRQAVRLQPDTVGYFNYASGTPTFNFRSAASLSAASVAVLAGSVDQITLTPRYDLQLPGITINYETTFSVNGGSYIALTTDTAGSTTDARAPAIIYPLQGVQADVAQQSVVVQAYPFSLNDTTFWTSLLPWLGSAASVSVASATRSGLSGYQNMLVDGSIAPWMNIGSERETLTCLVSYTTKDGSGNVCEVVSGRAISVPVTSCATGVPSSSSTSGTLTTNTYQATLSYTAAEPQPSGLAAALYASWQRLHWDGSFRMVEQECSFAVTPATLVNLTGGLSAWASMAALVPEVNYDIESGVTAVTCGTFGRLQADSLVAFWRGIHHYRPAFRSAGRTTGAGSGGSIIQGGNNVARLSTCEGDSGQPKRTVLRGTDGASYAQTIDINPGAIAFNPTANEQSLTLSPREVLLSIIDSNGVPRTQRAQVLCSPSYGATNDSNFLYPESYTQVGGYTYNIGPESALTDSWTRSASSPAFLILIVDTRARYYSAGDKKWYVYQRSLTFDALGHLSNVSPEYRSIFETPVGYP